MGYQRGGVLRPTAAVGAVVGLLLVFAACSSSPRKPRANDVPVTPTAVAQAVDVCSLLPKHSVEQLLDTKLVQVGAEYLPPALPTYRCEFGTKFAEPLVAVQLSIGPLSRNVFDKAYGGAAGGDPTLVRDLGDLAYLRRENSVVSVAVLVHASVASIEIQVDPAQPVEDDAVEGLAQDVVAALPVNPALAEAPQSNRCAAVGDAALNEALTGTPTLTSGLATRDGSLMCSWAAQPGGVIVTQQLDRAQVGLRRTQLEPIDYLTVPTVETLDTTGQTEAWSRVDVPGDLVIFVGADQLIEISLTPVAGYSDDELPTTPSEVDLAKAVLEALARTAG